MIGIRFEKYLKKKGIQKKDAAKLLDIHVNTITNWKRPDKTIYVDSLKKVSEQFPDINLHWLITGDGDMLLKTHNESKSKESQPKYREKRMSEIDELREEINRLSKSVDKLMKDKK